MKFSSPASVDSGCVPPFRHHNRPLQLNKYLHIYAGWVSYAAGAVQCYRGLELVAGNDQLVFSAAETEFTVCGAIFNVRLTSA